MARKPPPDPPKPLVCAECGKGFDILSHLATVPAPGRPMERMQIMRVKGHPLWCPDCIKKRAKPNPYLEVVKANEEKRRKGQ